MHTCSNCSSNDLVTVSLTINNEPVSFDHCRRCEHKTWTANGTSVPLSDVLDKVGS